MGSNSQVSAVLPANFNFLGAYEIGLNSSQYYAMPWGCANNAGYTPLIYHPTAFPVIFGNCPGNADASKGAGGANATRAAGDVGVRVVGLVA